MGGEPRAAVPHFRRPFLAVDDIAAGPRTDEVVLRRGDRELSLDIDGDRDAAMRVLGTLRDPSSAVWGEVTRSPTVGVGQLVDQLDRCGWLLDADDSAASRVVQRVGQLESLCDEAVKWLDDAKAVADGKGEATVRRLLSTVMWAGDLAAALEDARSAGRLTAVPDPRDDGGSPAPDVAARALHLSLTSWQRTSPLTLQVVARALQRSAAGGPAWAARYPRHVPRSDVAGPGVNVLVVAEHCAERLMIELGRSPLFATMATAEGAERAARYIYQHQHFVTVRYIEAIFSFLRYRLDEPVRRVGLRYLNEEQGHESHELAACLELGLTESDVCEFAPFPLFAAYPEVLGALAERDPLSFCLAVTAAEGMPAAVKQLPGALASSGVAGVSLGTHVEIDVVLDHAQFTRRLLGTVPWVPAPLAARALADVLFVVELSQLAWRQIAGYAARSDLSPTPRPFALTPDDFFAIWANT